MENSFGNSQVDASFSSIDTSLHLNEAISLFYDPIININSLHSTPANKFGTKPQKESCELTPLPDSPAPKAIKRHIIENQSKETITIRESIFEGSEGSFVKRPQKAPIIIFNEKPRQNSRDSSKRKN
jgi:hypothetical protein